MIKLLLKHCVYELCIETLFNNILNNFHVNKFGLKEGNTYNFIEVKFADMREHCKIYNVKVKYADSVSFHFMAKYYIMNGTKKRTDLPNYEIYTDLLIENVVSVG